MDPPRVKSRSRHFRPLAYPSPRAISSPWSRAKRSSYAISERMCQAIKGKRGTVRYVTLPYEAHGYVGLESVEHTLWEMLTWYNLWVKNAPASASVTAK